jgi:Rrf2 family protein
MLFSKACTYAIRAAVLAAAKDPDGQRAFIPIRELAEEVDVSFHFLTKILRRLTEANIMESFRGPNGGVGLIRPAREISVIDIVASVDGLGLFQGCALGLPQCSDESPCPLHDAWRKRREDLKNMLTRTTLADLVRNQTRKSARR